MDSRHIFSVLHHKLVYWDRRYIFFECCQNIQDDNKQYILHLSNINLMEDIHIALDFNSNFSTLYNFDIVEGLCHNIGSKDIQCIYFHQKVEYLKDKEHIFELLHHKFVYRDNIYKLYLKSQRISDRNIQYTLSL